MRLKDRNRQVPGGLTYYIPQIPNWRPQQWSSLDSLAQQVLAVRQANPFLTQKHNWSLDLNQILNEVDEMNANYQAQLGNMNFVVGDGGSPPPNPRQPPSQQEVQRLSAVAAKARSIWSGIKTLGAWLESGGEAVDKGTAESRADTCIKCPLNGEGDLSRWFTIPAAGAIQRQLQKLHERELSTSVDGQLNICEACLCPMKLKVWVPVGFIKANTPDETLDKLRAAPACWIPKELAQS